MTIDGDRDDDKMMILQMLIEMIILKDAVDDDMQKR